MNKLFGDLKTDEEKSNFFLSGRGYETGVIAAAMQNDVAMAYHRCAEYKKELAALQAARTEAVQGEPTDAELLAFAGEENFFLFCDEDEFLQIARAVIHWYMRRQTAVQGEPDVSAL